jgi:hypothetical protein
VVLWQRREERAQFRESRGIVPVLGCRAGPLQLKDALQVCCPRIGTHVYRHLSFLSSREFRSTLNASGDQAVGCEPCARKSDQNSRVWLASSSCVPLSAMCPSTRTTIVSALRIVS